MPKAKTNANSLFPDDEFGERTVSVLLDGEESEMIFIDHPSSEMSVSRKNEVLQIRFRKRKTSRSLRTESFRISGELDVREKVKYSLHKGAQNI